MAKQEKEPYQPKRADYEKAKDIMTDEQKEASEKRDNEAYRTQWKGYDDGRLEVYGETHMTKEQLEASKRRADLYEEGHKEGVENAKGWVKFHKEQGPELERIIKEATDDKE